MITRGGSNAQVSPLLHSNSKNTIGRGCLQSADLPKLQNMGALNTAPVVNHINCSITGFELNSERKTPEHWVKLIFGQFSVVGGLTECEHYMKTFTAPKKDEIQYPSNPNSSEGKEVCFQSKGNRPYTHFQIP